MATASSSRWPPSTTQPAAMSALERIAVATSSRSRAATLRASSSAPTAMRTADAASAWWGRRDVGLEQRDQHVLGARVPLAGLIARPPRPGGADGVVAAEVDVGGADPCVRPLCMHGRRRGRRRRVLRGTPARAPRRSPRRWLSAQHGARLSPSHAAGASNWAAAASNRARATSQSPRCSAEAPASLAASTSTVCATVTELSRARRGQCAVAPQARANRVHQPAQAATPAR